MHIKQLVSGGSNGEKLSLGRTMLLTCFIIAISFWCVSLYMYLVNKPLVEMPESLETIIQSLLVFEVFKKGRDVASEMLTKKSVNKSFMPLDETKSS